MPFKALVLLQVFAPVWRQDLSPARADAWVACGVADADGGECCPGGGANSWLQHSALH